MRDFETLIKEAEALTDEDAQAWFDRLTLDERGLFLQQWDPNILADVQNLWMSKTGIAWEIDIPEKEVPPFEWC
jgi:hypothetical protein